MKSFFTRFKDNLKIDFGGRYFEVILMEVLKEDLSILKIIFPSIDTKLLKKKNDLEINVEGTFPSKSGEALYRKSDLVVKYKGKYIALLEIKYEDELRENQLEDYIKYAQKNDIYFAYLTQYLQRKEDVLKLNTLKKSNHLLYKDLYNSIIKSKKDSNPIVKLFCQFMKENFMIYENEIPEDGLLLLIIKGLSLKHRHGFGRKVSSANIKAIPGIWEVLINNISLIGDKFYNDFSNFFNNRFSLDFGFDPHYKVSTLNKDIKNAIKAEEEYLSIDRERKVGGDFFLSVYGKVKQANSDNSLYIEFGYWFSVDLEEKELTQDTFASVSVKGKGFAESVYESEQIPNEYHPDSTGGKKMLKLLNESTFYNKTLTLIKNSIERGIDENPDLNSSFNKSLISLKEDIIKNIKK